MIDGEACLVDDGNDMQAEAAIDEIEQMFVGIPDDPIYLIPIYMRAYQVTLHSIMAALCHDGLITVDWSIIVGLGLPNINSSTLYADIMADPGQFVISTSMMVRAQNATEHDPVRIHSNLQERSIVELASQVGENDTGDSSFRCVIVNASTDATTFAMKVLQTETEVAALTAKDPHWQPHSNTTIH